MGSVDKLTLPLEGKPLLVRTLEPFLNFPRMDQIVVAVNPQRVQEFQELFAIHFPNRVEKVKVTAGGAHRQESILNALRLLAKTGAASPHPVLIHDGARPFVTASLFRQLLEPLDSFEGVIPALPVRDTIKRVDGKSVTTTEDRQTLRLVQTPQVFKFGTILSLHETASEEGFLGTDDASLLERYGHTVGWVEGPSYNLKVTLPEDIVLLSHLYKDSSVGAV